MFSSSGCCFPHPRPGPGPRPPIPTDPFPWPRPDGCIIKRPRPWDHSYN